MIERDSWEHSFFYLSDVKFLDLSNMSSVSVHAFLFIPDFASARELNLSHPSFYSFCTLRTLWHTVDLQCLWRFLNSAHPSIRYPMLFRGIITPSFVPGGPDVQHILDASSMSVSFSLSFFVLARTTMKAPAKWDKHCELQDSANPKEVERILLFGLFLKAACHYWTCYITACDTGKYF